MVRKQYLIGSGDVVNQILDERAVFLWESVAYGIWHIDRGGTGLDHRRDDVDQKVRVAAASILPESKPHAARIRTAIPQ